MDKEKIKSYIENVGTFIERFAQARLAQLGASKDASAELSEDIKTNVMQKDPSPIRHWAGLGDDEKKKLAECILMLKELKHVLLKKDNVDLVEGLDGFIVDSTKELVEATEGDDTEKLIESLKTPVEAIHTFSQVQTISVELKEAQEVGDIDKLVELKAALDKLTK